MGSVIHSETFPGASCLLIAANPFEAAMRSSSTEAYLSMANAGLDSLFDPIPKNSLGQGLASHLLQSSHPLLAPTLARFGMSFLSDCERPHGMSRIAFPMRELGFESAPLAAMALASGWRSLDPFWTGLTSAEIKSIAGTALPLACFLGLDAPVKVLLDAGADPNLLLPTGDPVASLARAPQALALLIAAGADLRSTLSNHSESPRVTVLDSLLLDKSLRADNKELRAMALQWSADHPLPEALPGQNVARLAFEALSKSNKDVARSCITSLGPMVVGQRNSAGQTLLTCALASANYIEANRLLSLGMDPYEQDASGASAWAQLSAARAGYRLSNTDRARIAGLLDQLRSKRKYRNIPWLRQSGNGSGSLMIEWLFGNAPISVIHELLPEAINSGLSIDARLSSGLSLTSTLLLYYSTTAALVKCVRSDHINQMHALMTVSGWQSSRPAGEKSSYCDAFIKIQRALSTPKGHLLPEFAKAWACESMDRNPLAWSSLNTGSSYLYGPDFLKRMHADMIYEGVIERADLGLDSGLESLPDSALAPASSGVLLAAYEARSLASVRVPASTKSPRL